MIKLKGKSGLSNRASGHHTIGRVPTKNKKVLKNTLKEQHRIRKVHAARKKEVIG